MELSPKVARVLAAEGISAPELAHMLKHSAITHVRGCNRRYYSWVFARAGDYVQDMQKVDLVEIGHGSQRMLEEHEPCSGDGCRLCGWIGSVSRAVTDTTATSLRG